MKHRSHLAAVAAAVAAGTALAVLAAPAQAAPPSMGCPHNWTRFYYPTDLVGYRVPAEVDSPDQNLSFGHQPGNGNRYVCGVALGNRGVDGKQIYNFMDDSLTVEG